MGRTAKKIGLCTLYQNQLLLVNCHLLTTQCDYSVERLETFQKLRGQKMLHSTLWWAFRPGFETMTMLFKGHITNYNLRPRFFLIACYTSGHTFPGKPSCRYFTAALLFWKLVTSSSGFHAANSKPSSRLEISLTQECGCSRCASTDSVTKTVLNV